MTASHPSIQSEEEAQKVPPRPGWVHCLNGTEDESIVKNELNTLELCSSRQVLPTAQ